MKKENKDREVAIVGSDGDDDCVAMVQLKLDKEHVVPKSQIFFVVLSCQHDKHKSRNRLS